MRKVIPLMALLIGCQGGGPPVAPPLPPGPVDRGLDWKQVVLPDLTGTGSTLVGYCHAEPATGAGRITHVYDRTYREVGFVTPAGRAFRLVRPGESAETIELGEGEPAVAIARIFGLDRPVVIADWTAPPLEPRPAGIR